jgi:hypothetical protein
MATYRIFQQIRLWIYLVMILIAIGGLWSGDGNSAGLFFCGALAMTLVFLEVCPECNRLVWQEHRSLPLGAFWIGLPLRAFWIGSACRHRPDRGA